VSQIPDNDQEGIHRLMTSDWQQPSADVAEEMYVLRRTVVLMVR